LAFRNYFEAKNYKVVEIKVTNGFEWFSGHIQPTVALAKKPLLKRYETYIAYGDQLRSVLDNDVLAAYSIARIMHRRSKISQTDEERYSKIAYLIHQFKRPEEIDLLRSVYGALFFQISVYSRRGARVAHLSERFAKDNNSGMAEDYRADAEKLCREDENEKGEDHGQRVGKVFHDADVIISLDAVSSPDDQV